jgi:inorganic pyrophosphatase
MIDVIDLSASGVENAQFEVVIEISAGSRTKYEVNPATGELWLDRVLSSVVPYPFSYGFLPSTLSLDGDPLDAVVLCSEPLHPLVHLFCRAVAVLNITDQSGPDEKLICVPVADPVFASVASLETLPPSAIDAITVFFSTYKVSEPGKWVELNGWDDAAVANQVVELARLRFSQRQTS